MYKRPFSIPTISPAKSKFILGSCILWIIVLVGVFCYSYLRSGFDSGFLEYYPVRTWDAYISPLRWLDVGIILYLLAWGFGGLWSYPPKKKLYHYVGFVVMYTLYFLVTSPIMVGLYHFIMHGCWDRRC